MKIQSLGAVNRFYAPQLQSNRTAVSRPISKPQNQVAFGACSISKLNVEDAVKAYNKLLGVPVEKIADDSGKIKFETVESFPLIEGYKLCEEAKKAMEKMHQTLSNFSIKTEKSLGEFTKSLYEYTQMGGGGKNISSFNPAGAGESYYLNGATPRKVTVPIVIDQFTGIHSGHVKTIETSRDTLIDLSKILPRNKDPRIEENSLRVDVDGENYILHRSDECLYTGTLFSAQKV